MSPLTGSEPKYEPSKWSVNPKIRKTHNCFSYAMNVQDPKQIKRCEEDPDCNVSYHQPGSAGGWEGFSNDKAKSCPEMKARIRGENPMVNTISFEGKCPVGSSKIALAVDPKEDYHFWRQDSNGMWSGKPGSLKVTSKDASGRPIYDPALCDRDYSDNNSELNYTHFCHYYCVPRNRSLFMKVGGANFTVDSKPSGSFGHDGLQAKHRYPSTRRSSGRRQTGPRRNQTFRRERDEA